MRRESKMKAKMQFLKLTMILNVLVPLVRSNIYDIYRVLKVSQTNTVAQIFTEKNIFDVFFDEKHIVLPKGPYTTAQSVSSQFLNTINGSFAGATGQKHTSSSCISDPHDSLIDSDLTNMYFKDDEASESCDADHGLSSYLPDEIVDQAKISYGASVQPLRVSQKTTFIDPIFQQQNTVAVSTTPNLVVVSQTSVPQFKNIVLKVDYSYIKAMCSFECFIVSQTITISECIFKASKETAIEFERFKRMVLSKIRYDVLFPRCQRPELLSFIALAANYATIGERDFEPILWTLAYISWSTGGLSSVSNYRAQNFDSRGLLKITGEDRYRDVSWTAKKSMGGWYINFVEHPWLANAECPFVFCIMFDYAYTIARREGSLENFLENMKPAQYTPGTFKGAFIKSFFDNYAKFAYKEFVTALQSVADELGYKVCSL
ncbi:hypothetical protein EDEG_02012 [Edhazardia aedis USNM 41457]|uniref:Uncharacterized protein n=1 Tax=Edhazardia aedis (strain USNM 41457) TaxID=1003232 RepID=J8ZVJ1_EDHAE|nr:hypothetical protein EDEG_02012 [Edhazardia aedis USNM 41457]|eukprot:EJW03663.1 hypothetical protein EDEG_02012 [Edhazardia aedis USNM 41457]